MLGRSKLALLWVGLQILHLCFFLQFLQKRTLAPGARGAAGPSGRSTLCGRLPDPSLRPCPPLPLHPTSGRAGRGHLQRMTAGAMGLAASQVDFQLVSWASCALPVQCQALLELLRATGLAGPHLAQLALLRPLGTCVKSSCAATLCHFASL